MVRRSLAVALVAMAALSNSAGVASAQPGSPTQHAAGGRYIVVFNRQAPEGSEDAAIARARADGATVRHRYSAALRGFAGDLSEDQLAAIRDDPNVAYVEADSGVTIADTQQNPPSWGLDRIDQRTLPLDNSYTYVTSGSGVNAYVIDTGIRTTHLDFGGRASIGVDEVNDGTTANDCNGHGTHVAGTLGGTEYGVAKQVELIAVRVLDCSGNGAVSDVVAGIDWVTQHRVLPAVANLSLDGSPSRAMDDAVANSIASGVVYSIAAGNTKQDACGFSPARVGPAITVAASTITDSRATLFSNFGPCVDLFAPGENITSDSNASDTGAVIMSGTSMSAPHVAGAAALLLEANPSATPSSVRNQLVTTATRNVIANEGAGTPDRLLDTLGTAPSTRTGTVADGWGGLHPFRVGSATTLNAANAPYWPGWDIVRGVAISADGLGGYELDGWGGLHPFHFQGGADPAALAGDPYWPGNDIARGVAVAGGGGYVVDGWGGLHPLGVSAAARNGPYWPGWDIVRSVALLPDGSGGYVLDAWGGLHPFACGFAPMPPPVSNAPYWPGWDIARGVAILPDASGGYVLDGWGGLHPFGIGGRPAPPAVTNGSYWSGWDIARGASIQT